MVSHHVTRLHAVFEDLHHCTPDVTGSGCLPSVRLVVRNHHPNIDDWCVVDTKTLLPQQRPLALVEVAGAKVHRPDHQQAVIMRMGRPISATSDFYRPDPTHSRPTPELCQSYPCFAHEIERCSQLIDFAIANRKGHEEKTRVGKVFYHSWKCLVDFCLPAERSPPLTDRTMTDSAKPGVLEFQFGWQVVLRRVSGKFQDLRTICDSLSVAVMSAYRTAGVDFGNVVGFAPVAIPRLIFR